MLFPALSITIILTTCSCAQAVWGVASRPASIWCWTMKAPGDLPLGSGCRCNNECLSGKCQGDKCVCWLDSDCGPGWKCINRLKPNYCVQAGPLPLNAHCVHNSQCESDKCQGDHCVCTNDSHCPSGQNCYTPLLSPNYCEVPDLPLGASCSKDSQCATDHCNWGQCACKYDHHCASGNCKRRLGRNKCV